MRSKKELNKLLEKYWDDQGACSSCNWHASLWEHDPEWSDWDEDEGCFIFYCQSEYNDGSHRDIKVYISDEDKTKYKLKSL